MTESNTASFNELMARIGSLFLHWGLFEKALLDRQQEVSSAHTLPGVQDARRIRNLIAHGIFEAAAFPESPPYLLCRTKEGAVESVTLAELDRAITALECEKYQIAPPQRRD